MKQIRLVLAGAVAVAFNAWPACAAEVADKSTSQTLIEVLLPLLLLFGVLYFVARRVNKRNGPYMDRAMVHMARAMVHMERLETQNAEIISLLKDLAGKKEK